MKTRTFTLVLALGVILYGCASQRKLTQIRRDALSARISLPSGSSIPRYDTTRKAHRDTLKFMDFEGREVIIMNAIKDEDGEMVAHDVIDAAVVTARFRNVAERHGRVEIEFQVTVPAAMQDTRWQLRFTPEMHILGDTLMLDSLIITGADYRKAQLRGYQQYYRFLNSIITDTTRLVNRWQLELFIRRNIPALYAFKTDSTFVSDSLFESAWGVTEHEAVDHYTYELLKRWNERRKSRSGDMYRRYVKAPLIKEGVRLDTVLVNSQGDFVYNYVQEIATRPSLRKVDIVLSGDICQLGKKLYDIPRSEPLSFYISSLSSFADNTEHYMTKVIERRVEANTACYVDFEQGRAEVNEDLGHNADEIRRIKRNLRDILGNEKFDLDSITIEAFASPEGSVRANETLCLGRSRSVSKYFSDYVSSLRDSLSREHGIGISVDEHGVGRIAMVETVPDDIRFISRSGGENWDMFRTLVQRDDSLSQQWKEHFESLFEKYPEADIRERTLKKDHKYRYLREKIYPRLRVVKFNFYLHRKGMVKDTVHTTVLDSVYMAGVQALRDRDYQRAITLLRPYNDYNTAIAYCSMDYNASAMAILKDLERTPQVNYMLSVLYSRSGDWENAVKHYLQSCKQEPAYIHRGNLDPEISALIKQYALNQNEDEEDFTN